MKYEKLLNLIAVYWTEIKLVRKEYICERFVG
jgi:hypothetical protein